MTKKRISWLVGYILGIGKGKITMMPDGSSAEILRLVTNLMPSNEVQEQVTGDNGTLPYPGCWHSLLLESDTIIFGNSEDMQASCLPHELPLAWRGMPGDEARDHESHSRRDGIGGA